MKSIKIEVNLWKEISVVMSKKNNPNIKNIIIYVLAFAIPLVIMLLAYAKIGIYPFGSKSILIYDLKGQYSCYFEYYRQIFTNHDSLLYSFSKPLGGNMLELFAYYLASPLNLIILFFSKSNIPEAILILTLLKIGLCGITFLIYLKGNYKKLSYDMIIFSTCYALMTYNIVYQQNIMWLDGIILLPLILLGIDKIINSNNTTIYIIALFLAIICNFYIAYIICIFSLLYFIYKSLLWFHNSDIPNKIKYFSKKIFIWICSSLIAAGLSAFLIMPTIYALKSGKASFKPSTLQFVQDYDFYKVFSKMFIGAFNWDEIPAGLPSIFCGTLIVILVILFFFNKKIRFSEKVYTFIFILIILVSFNINALNLIWHAFNPPNSFVYRNAFIYGFLLISIAYKSYINLDSFEVKKVPIAAVMFLLISIIFIKVKFTYLSSTKVYATVFYALLYCIGLYIIFIMKFKYIKKVFIVICSIIVFSELGLNSVLILKKYNYFDRGAYASYFSKNSSEVDNISEKDKSFYRMENTNYDFSLNDAMTFNYKGLSHYSSTQDVSTLYFMKQIGFQSNCIWAYDNNSSTILTDSILGVKYIMAEDLNNKYYNKLTKYGYVPLYENPYFLSIGFLSDNQLQDVSINNNNPFDLQNSILKSMVSIHQTDYLYKIKIKKINLNNVIENEVNNSLEYEKKDPNKDSYVEYILNCDNEYPIYAFLQSNKCGIASISVNNKNLGNYFDTNNYNALSLGSFKKGTDISFKVKLIDNKISISNSMFYYLNMDNFRNAYNELSKNEFNIASFKNDQIIGTVDAKEDKTLLYTSIPFDEGWKIKINGKQTEKIKVLNSLIGVKVPKGKSKIEMSYTPPKLIEGIIISIISLILAVFIRNIAIKLNKE